MRSVSRRICRKTLGLSLTAALALTAFAGMGVAASAANDPAETSFGLVENIQDGTILHCYDWKYNDIKAELPNIAKAGFTSVQTSPAQPNEGSGTWYWLYQPLSFTAGPNELGTADDLKALCDEADKYGIKVIVDVVANHLAGNHDDIDPELKADKYWHNEGMITDYTDRYQVTHGDLGMADINSEDTFVQNKVKAYVNELKSLGIDGIRWDAAKHIGLPSEGCDFWKTVTSDKEMYHYGEILDEPGGDNPVETMKEDTDYISVTDSFYGSALLYSVRDGRAPSSDGAWTDDGIKANKLIYWGESHDTYSNGENQQSNGIDQNIVDRAYAVAAARKDAASLYLSRPFAKAKESIRIGDKGSMHFTSPEIAAVNHFHNAMLDKDDLYASSNNCAVVTRKDGGAVIVCGSGSGQVSVDNVGGYVPSGEYYDEVTGNVFAVTAETITGTVGESGIAVIYDSEFASKVYAEPDTDTSFVGSIDVTLHAVQATDTKYTVEFFSDTNETTEGTFSDGDVITIGQDASEDTLVTLTLYGKNADGKEVSSVYKYNKKIDRQIPELTKGGVVFDNTNTGWSTVNVYIYDESGTVTITNGEWPGVKMTDNGNEYYSYELPEQFENCKHIMVIFNNGAGDQIPGAMQTGLTLGYKERKLYNGTEWLDLPGSEPSKPDDPTPPDDRVVSPYSIIGSMTSWSKDIPMYYVNDNVVSGEFTLSPGSYEFKVRKDAAWDLSWGVYEPDYDRTQNSQTNCNITVENVTTVTVILDMSGDDMDLWPITYFYRAGGDDSTLDDLIRVYTGKEQEEPAEESSDDNSKEESSKDEPSNEQSKEDEQSSKEQTSDGESSNQTSTQPSKPAPTPSAPVIETSDSTPASMIILLAAASAITAVFAMRKKKEQ